MSTSDNPNQSGFIQVPALDENGHIPHPSEWLLGIAEQHGLDRAQMALKRAAIQGFIAESPTPTATEEQPALPEWQVTAMDEERRIRRNAPTYARPVPHAVDQTDKATVYTGGHMRKLREQLPTEGAAPTEPLTRRQMLDVRRAAEAALKAAGIQAIRDSRKAYLREQ